MADSFSQRLQDDEAERPIRFAPTFRQLHQMFWHNWKSVRLDAMPAGPANEFRITVAILDKRLFWRAPDSTISFVLKEGTDEVTVSTNVTYLDFFGEEILDGPGVRIPRSRKEKTKVTFSLRGRGSINLFRYEGQEGFQVSLYH